jgi:hypothetical protein
LAGRRQMMSIDFEGIDLFQQMVCAITRAEGGFFPFLCYLLGCFAIKIATK